MKVAYVVLLFVALVVYLCEGLSHSVDSQLSNIDRHNENVKM